MRRHGHAYVGITVERGRIYIRGTEGVPDLSMVLGVYSYSPALELPRDYEALKAETARFFPEIRRRRSFRVSCQRIDKDFSPDSMGVEKEIGTIISENTGTPVRLKEPDFELHIEIGHRHFYLFSEKIRGFGGFPVGSAGKLVSLISGGIDSPVATFLMMKRGVLPLLLHFAVSESETAKVLRLRDRLQEFAAGQELKLIVIPARICSWESSPLYTAAAMSPTSASSASTSCTRRLRRSPAARGPWASSAATTWPRWRRRR